MGKICIFFVIFKHFFALYTKLHRDLNFDLSTLTAWPYLSILIYFAQIIHIIVLIVEIWANQALLREFLIFPFWHPQLFKSY